MHRIELEASLLTGPSNDALKSVIIEDYSRVYVLLFLMLDIRHRL